MHNPATRGIYIRCSNDGSVYIPDERFMQDLRLHRDTSGEECDYIPSDCPTPDYRILNREQLGYYFYWRSRVREGVCPRTDEGYVWLLLCEIVNSDDPDYDRDLGVMELILDDCGYLRNRDLVRSTIMDLAVARNRDLPRMWLPGWDVRWGMLLSEMFSSPIDRLDFNTLFRLAGRPEVFYGDTHLLEDLMNLALLRIDRRMILDTGAGIAETYGRDRTSDLMLFKGLVHPSEGSDFTILYRDMGSTEFRGFIYGLLRYCEQILFKTEGIRGPPAPRVFGSLMRKVTDSALEDLMNGKGDDVRGPKASRGTVRNCVSPRERMLMDLGREMGFEDPYSDDPVMDRPGEMKADPTSGPRMISKTFREDLRRNEDAVADPDCPYVPSGYTTPDYRSFSDEQRGFYLRWREEVRNGVYGDTDQGYVWLLLCELINSESDPELNLGIMRGMGLIYEQDSGRPLIRQTYLDYAMVNRIDAVDPSVRRCTASMSMAMTAFLDRELDTVDGGTLLDLAGITHKSMRTDFDSDCAAIVSEVLRRIDDMAISEGGLFQLCELSFFPITFHPFTRLKYYGRKPESTFLLADFESNDRFTQGLRDLCRCVIQHVRRRSGRKVQLEPFVGFGDDHTDVVRDVVADWFEGSVKAPGTTGRTIVLDRKAVDDAESDLRSVTELMATDLEDGPIPDDVTPIVTERSAEGQWSAFMASLTEREVDLLTMMLRGNSVFDVRMVDSINLKAMGTVGDTVIESGSLVDDYMDDIRRVMGG